MSASKPLLASQTISFPALKRHVWLWIWLSFFSLVSYCFVNRFIITAVIVQGRSMTPTLQDGERYLLNRWTYHHRSPQRGDLIVLRDPGHSDYSVKRIVALPGEAVYLKQGTVFVNGKFLIEPYLPSGTSTYAPDLKDKFVLLGQDQYFVLGDNRGNSEDSRFYGAVLRNHIVGFISK